MISESLDAQIYVQYLYLNWNNYCPFFVKNKDPMLTHIFTGMTPYRHEVMLW